MRHEKQFCMLTHCYAYMQRLLSIIVTSACMVASDKKDMVHYAHIAHELHNHV